MNEPSLINPQGPDARALVQADDRLPDVYQTSAVASDPLFDISSIRGLINRQLYAMLGTFLVVVVLGGVYSALQTPLYTASATVRIQPNGSTTMSGLGLTGAMSSVEMRTYLKTMVAVAKSQSLATSVAEELNLADRPEFLGSDIESRRPQGQSDEQWQQSKLRMASSKVKGSVKVVESLAGDSIVTLRYTNTSPALAAEIANGYATVFSAFDTRSDLEDSKYAKKYLEDQIEVTRTELREAESAANLYARNAALVSASAIDLDSGAVATVTGANLASINSTFGTVRAERIKAEQRWRTVENVDPSAIPEVQNNPSIQALLQQKLDLQSELVRLRERYNDQFPEIVNVRLKIEQIDNQVESVSQNIKASIRNDFLVAQRQEAALRGELENVTSSALDEQDRQVQLDVLKRDSQALKL
ncbi:MAG: Wzz/FepE/Etk N-terminal domain-containing protein, partial [Pseudomonadota bacterium]